MSTTLRILPLGGFDQVGANAVVYETPSDLILVDCGIAFPSNDYLGVQALAPNPRYIEERLEKFRGYVITHGHEDHIGALLYFRSIVPGPIYGTSLVRELLERRYQEREELLEGFIEIQPGTSIDFDSIKVEAIHITHSIPQSLAFSIEASHLRVIHTGDFKLDESPLSGIPSDMNRFEKLGALGVDLMVADSTNASRAGRTPSEHEVYDTILDIVATSERRVVLTTFPTNLERVKACIDAASSNNRLLIPLGRSAEKMVEIGIELGLLPESAPLANRHQLKSLEPDQQLILAAGCQGDPRSTMQRVAQREHPMLHLEAGDTFIYSARKIPGNERKIAEMYDALVEQGVQIIDERSRSVHTSGHAQHDELLELYNAVDPIIALPGLGSRALRQYHAELLLNHGRAPGDIVMLDNGLGADFKRLPNGDIEYRLTKQLDIPLDAIERSGRVIDDELLDERARLASEGVLSISAVFDSRFERAGDFTIETHGIHPDRLTVERQNMLRERLHDAVDSFPSSQGPKSRYSLERLMTRAAVNELRKFRLRPVILMHCKQL